MISDELSHRWGNMDSPKEGESGFWTYHPIS